ncbi:MAG: TonB-dependent receptor [Ferruginibacter sp.]
MKKLYAIAIFLIISNILFAQSGKISGKIINASSGQALANATIILIEKSKTETADQNGNFVFSKLAAGTYSIKCSYAGHLEKIIEEIILKDNENFVITVSLTEKKSDAVVVTSTRVRAAGESVASLLVAQKNNASVSDGITAESIRKTPDRSTSDVLKRVSGASIQDDRFAIIRGLNDRYNAAFINGAPLPSTESDRKAFAFDIFPSAILDNLVIYKTATPDKTGDFAGGIIDITTKSIFPKNFTSISIGGSYNSLITGKNRFFSENKGRTDWIGIDDGLRAIPSRLPTTMQMGALTNALRGDFARTFENYKWGVKQGNTLPNYNFQISKGINIERNQKEFAGALFSLSYNRNYTFSEGNRDQYTPDKQIQTVEIQDSIYNDEVVLAALANISVKINNQNTVSWKNNLSINTDNKLIKRIGVADIQSDPNAGYRDVVRAYTSNQIFSSQLSGEHLVGKLKTKINWQGSYSQVKRELPNYSRTSYNIDMSSPGSIGTAIFNTNPSQLLGCGTMFFVGSNENIKSIKADIAQPYTLLNSSQNFLKIGGGYQERKRDFTSRLLGFAPYNTGIQYDFTLEGLPEEQIFLPQHFGKMANGKGGFLVRDANTPNSNYDANSATTHAFILNDQRFFKKFRLIYGIRMEKFTQKLNSPSGFANVPSIKVDSTVSDFLPSVNFVYAVTPKMNVRLSYSQTVNRPEFRELAPFVFYDYQLQYSVGGDTRIQRAKIKNYDFRYEFYPGKAQLFSVSAFYKEFKNPIEVVFVPDIPGQAFYTNVASATTYGIEAEFRTLISTLLGVKREKAFLNKFTLSANVAYIKSNVKVEGILYFDPAKFSSNRPLQGQSPYLINGSLGFNDEKIGLSSTISVNRVGDRLSIAGNYLVPELYEKARTVVDFQLAKYFLKNRLELKLNARDILAEGFSFYTDIDKSKSFTEMDQNFSTTKMPKVFSFAATYKF